MMQLDSLELKNGVEEFQDRHCKTVFYEIAEHDSL